MYQAVQHEGPGAFLNRAEPWLLSAEAENNLVLGLAYRVVEAGDDVSNHLYATVEADGEVVGCFMRTPPHKLLVTDMPLGAAPSVADLVALAYGEIPTVLGPDRAAEAVAMEWVARRGGGWRPGMEQRIYRLDEVEPPEGVPGSFRSAGPDDLALALAWGAGFARDVGQQFRPIRAGVERWIRDGVLYLWIDGEARSIAVAQGGTPNGVRIGYVYTPPESRRRGYASAIVAAVSGRMLDHGKSFCVLYTDLSNPTSNAIYQQVGYRPLLDVRDYDLVPEDAL